MQRLKFSHPQTPSQVTQVEDVATQITKKRRRNKPDRFGEFATGDPKLESNDPRYWPEYARDVTQHIVIVRFDEKQSDQAVTKHAEHVSSLIKALDDASRASLERNPGTCDCMEPTLRPWCATLRIANQLKQHKSIAEDFSSLILEDLDDDRRVLEAKGFVFAT
jgi:hypothetical protein